MVFSRRSGPLQTVYLGLNFRTRPHSTRRKKSVVFQKTVIESTFDYGIEGKYEYWIVHFMNGLLNQQTIIFLLMSLLVR